jgi:hypothetical protein
LQIIVVTSSENLGQARNLIDRVVGFGWAESYEFNSYDFSTFEKTSTYFELAKKENWLFDYDRSRRGINRNHWSFCLKEIRFILIDPFAREIKLHGFVHEIAHLSTCQDKIAKLVYKQLNRPLMEGLRKKLHAKDDREQLLTSAVHVLIFPTEIIADRWMAERSRDLLVDGLVEACSVWRVARKDADNLDYSLGPALLCLRRYLSMQLQLMLAREYQIEDKIPALSSIIADYEKAKLVKLVPERTNLWNLASKLRIVQYVDTCADVVRRLARSMPLKSAKATIMPPIQQSLDRPP